MKKRLLFITLLLVTQLLSVISVYAQFFPTTTHAPCGACVPSQSYSVVSGTPSVSNKDMQGGQNPWMSAQGSIIQLPSPVSIVKGYQTDPPGNDAYGTFLTLQSGPASKDKVKFIVSGFIPGTQYTMEYGVSSSKTQFSNFGTSSIMEIGSVGDFPVLLATSQVNFDANSVNKWQLRYVQFTPTTSEVSFTLSGNTSVGTGFVNFDIWSKPLHCILPKDKQVVLTSTQVTTKYPHPYKTVELTNLIDVNSKPVGADVVWKMTSDVNGMIIPSGSNELVSVSPGEYYAFYYHKANACYSLESVASTSKVTVTYVPTQVPLKFGASIAIKCPNSSYHLSNKVLNPEGVVRWFDNNKHQGEPINEIVTQPGTYYAFYYNTFEDAYSVATSTSAVTVSFETPCCNAGTNQVTVQSNEITNSCPKSTADLTTTTLNFNVPLNTELVWFDNPNHTGSKINDPTAVGQGLYYAFIYDAGVPCYNTDNSTAQVKVDINPCLNNVQLNIKAALQGSMSAAGSKMRNDLQTYNGTGLLPTTSPYPVAATSYPSINNVAGVAGEVVDWILVEIRSSAAPQTVLQSATLLLKPDGTVVNRNGQTPTFNPQSGSVRIVLKHRNHLAIMSNPIQNFSAGSTLSYDFTTALSQASNEFGSPDQMIQKNGIWCMRVGDLNANQDFSVNGVDGSYFNVQFKQDVYDVYDRADLDMDGFVDGVDGSLFNTNFYLDIYSTIINY
jgi:hypothetical protein